MKTIYIERSTGGGRDGGWSSGIDVDGVERIVVGTGPGSFAGIRSALAFALGCAMGSGCEVLGLPSPCACAAQNLDEESEIAVVGDSRRGKAWIALFSGYSMQGDIFQVDMADIQSAVPPQYKVVSPDDGRIGAALGSAFGDRYLGQVEPTAEGLEKFAEKCPSALVADPLPVYLNPAVRP